MRRTNLMYQWDAYNGRRDSESIAISFALSAMRESATQTRRKIRLKALYDLTNPTTQK